MLLDDLPSDASNRFRKMIGHAGPAGRLGPTVPAAAAEIVQVAPPATGLTPAAGLGHVAAGVRQVPQGLGQVRARHLDFPPVVIFRKVSRPNR
jgi:hypothetical protein